MDTGGHLQTEPHASSLQNIHPVSDILNDNLQKALYLMRGH